MSSDRSVMWFRRDLRLADNPALLAAAEAEAVLPLFVLDPALWGPAGPSRRAYLAASLRSLDASLRSRRTRLSVLEGDPVEQVVAAAREVGASRVHVSADFGPYGSQRDDAVAEALAEHDVELVRTGSPYAVPPGSVRKGDDTPYAVFTPFSRAWAEVGWPDPAPAPSGLSGLELEHPVDLPEVEVPEGLRLPEAGERAAAARWEAYAADHLADYADARDRPDLDATSKMSVHLKWGEIHPRTMLAELGRAAGKGRSTYRSELAWREFYADVLHHRPDTAREYLRAEYARMEYDRADDALEQWQEGRTGFPIVDAGMRQLRGAGWMHNRVRMIVASFLVKDLHIEWQHGARHFLHWLVDGDLASNNHGWQWTAGSGTDASPFFRVFNPTSQGRKFDPRGEYVRRWVPELRDLPDGEDPHDPSPEARRDVGYPEPMVDHKAERAEALRRWESIRR
ncbi:deoxyribodipyrimidine photo-lyase [Nocardioides zeae]|uniref:Deoxyribodipyrimidine photo-lyase n=1 Tax=Nocardioides imazamoxiresistens TaxID=3231893 RepID=A0ABU3PY17_9ACTN|nr:deoxyribodipyrimidine photo-lyase [Nocardioides zeae]MDT9594128.1 deoxyribodipyrimidine photo-lyase [Nocardioides zeae]